MIVNTEEYGEIEVDDSQVELQEEDPFLSQDEVDGIVQKRLSRERNNLRSELKSDDEFFQEAAKERGIELREDGKPKGSLRDEELQELRQKASKAESLEEQLNEYESQIQETRETKLENKLLQNADGFRNENAKKTFLREAKSRMTYDDEYGWVQKGEEGDISWEAGEPRNPSDVIDDLSETHSFLFQDTEMDGGSPGTSSTPSGPASLEEAKKQSEQAKKNRDSESAWEALRKADQASPEQ